MATETLIQPAAAGKDTWLDEANPTINHGADDFMGVWRDAGNVDIRHALIEWDLAGLSIVQGMQVLFARMMLHANGVATGTLNEVIGAHRITADWNEGEATWNNRKTGIAWGTAGGDCEVGAQDTQLVNVGIRDTADAWFSFLLTQQVKDWLDSVDANYGLCFKWANELVADSLRGFRTSDDAIADQRPFLWVENDLSPVNLVPVADGYYNEWDPPGQGMPRFEAVCLPPNLSVEPLDDANRSVASGIAGNRQSFQTTGNLPSSISISSVKVCARLRRYGTSGDMEGRLGVLIGGTEYYHETPYYGNSNVWTDFEREWTTDPSTGLAWTREAANALEPITLRYGGSVSTRMVRCYVKVTFTQVAGEKEGVDSGIGSESSDVSPVAAGTDAGAGADASRVTASKTVLDTGAATEGTSQVVHNLLAGSDAGTATDVKVEYPAVEHLGLEPAVGLDLADLWWEIAVRTDSGSAPEEEAVVELNPIVGSDSGLGTEGAAERIGLYDRNDGAVGVDAASDIWAVMAASPETAVGLEAAERVGLLSRHIIRCSIESTLATLADSLSLALVEADPTDPLAPSAQSWLSFDEGDLVHVRLGLVGVGFDDYGIFRVDETNLQRTADAMVTTLSCRDKAALLIEEKGRAAGGFRFGSYEDEAQDEWTRPTSRAIARRLAAQVGLGLIWDAPNYPLKSFAIGRDEPVSTSLQRLLAPLQQSRRYRTDAWVDGDNLVVRRRGNAPVRGIIDCNLGLVTGIARRREPQRGGIDVYGGTEVKLTTYDWSDLDQETEHSTVEITDDGAGHRVVKTFLELPSGRSVQTQEEIEDQSFQNVFESPVPQVIGRWIGRVLVGAVTLIKTDMNTTEKQEKRTTGFAYDPAWRLVTRHEETEEYDSTSGEFEKKKQSHTRFEQITPTDVRTTITEWAMVQGPKGLQPVVKSGFPKRVEAPGRLQSSLHMAQDSKGAWEENEDGTQPTQAKKTEETVQYHGHADGGGALPQTYSNGNLMSHSACQQIADDQQAESGAWSYAIQLRWARPFQYRKADRVTLTHLPGGLASLAATILSVRTTYDRQQSEWTHEVSLEAWAES